jgi:L-erythro-3,5-diaminohexanoate dehydrogenase
MKKGCPYGTHRVISPANVLPQTAEKIDNTMEIYDNEILIDVITLNVDSASFTQIKNQANNNEEEIKKIMKSIVEKRGKHQNPVTGSGGMLIGKIAKIGDKLDGKIDLKVGDKIATLVSLSLTPLVIEEFKEIRMDNDQVDIKGQAILFESGIYAKLPEDFSERVALAALDVAGAPAQTDRLVKTGDTVVIFGGGGKSAILVSYIAKKKAGKNGKVIAIVRSKRAFDSANEYGYYDEIITADATNPVECYNKILESTNGSLADVTINCVNVDNTEMATILCTKELGKVYFFSMATSFTKAALGAEGCGKDVEMIIGNGYAKDHADFTMNILRESEKLKKLFEQKY